MGLKIFIKNKQKFCVSDCFFVIFFIGLNMNNKRSKLETCFYPLPYATMLPEQHGKAAKYPMILKDLPVLLLGWRPATPESAVRIAS